MYKHVWSWASSWSKHWSAFYWDLLLYLEGRGRVSCSCLGVVPQSAWILDCMISVLTQTHLHPFMSAEWECLHVRLQYHSKLWLCSCDIDIQRKTFKPFLSHSWPGQSRSVRGARNKNLVIAPMLFPQYKGSTATHQEVKRAKETRELSCIIGIQTNFRLFMKTIHSIILLV